jgi:hypothetical protein
VPLPWHALQVRQATVFEADARAGDVHGHEKVPVCGRI